MYDLALIGFGPANIEAFNIAVKNGLKVIVFEKNIVGGTCLNIGCIPTKTILHTAQLFKELKNSSDLGIDSNLDVNFNWGKILSRKDEIISKFNKNLNLIVNKKADFIDKEAKIAVENSLAQIVADDKIYSAKNIIIGTGSIPRSLNGLEFDNKFILNSDDMYRLQKLPKSILIVGSGAIGLEWAMILSNFNVDVTIVEKMPSLAPSFDIDIQKRLERILKLNNIKFFKNDFIKEINEDEIVLNSNNTVKADNILVAVGRKPILPEINCELKIDSNFKTQIDNLYVIGDALGKTMLAHSASYQAKELMNNILYKTEISSKQIPSVVYITPEIASIGLREQDILNKNDYVIKKLPAASILKSWCDNSSDGFIKVIIKDNKLLGAHIISKEASSLIAFLGYFVNENININEISKIIFPHPSMTELISEVLKID